AGRGARGLPGLGAGQPGHRRGQRLPAGGPAGRRAGLPAQDGGRRRHRGGGHGGRTSDISIGGTSMKELWIIGLGPGGGRDLTGRAREALEKADVIVGYTVYIDLIRAEFGHKELRTTPMRKEQERCEMALELAD